MLKRESGHIHPPNLAHNDGRLFLIRKTGEPTIRLHATWIRGTSYFDKYYAVRGFSLWVLDRDYNINQEIVNTQTGEIEKWYI